MAILKYLEILNTRIMRKTKIKVKGSPLDKLAGILTKEEAEEMRKHILLSRKQTEKRLKLLRKRLDNVFSKSR